MEQKGRIVGARKLFVAILVSVMALSVLSFVLVTDDASARDRTVVDVFKNSVARRDVWYGSPYRSDMYFSRVECQAGWGCNHAPVTIEAWEGNYDQRVSSSRGYNLVSISYWSVDGRSRCKLGWAATGEIWCAVWSNVDW